MDSNQVVVLHKLDNVAVVISNLNKGDMLTINGKAIYVASNIEFGHKIALQDLAVGEKILKYGVPIGIATREVKAGEHVHTQNIESLYMKQFIK